MRQGLALILVLLASLSAACGIDTVSSTESETEEAKKPTVSPVENPKLVVGDPATTTEDGNTLTVRSYEPSLSVEGAKPRPGFEFSAIDVEGCAVTSSGRDLMAIGPNAFTLRLPDGTRLKPEGFSDQDAPVKEPALQTMHTGGGTCPQGFVTFQVPRGEKPDLVVFEEPFVPEMPLIAWKVSDER